MVQKDVYASFFYLFFHFIVLKSCLQSASKKPVNWQTWERFLEAVCEHIREQLYEWKSKKSRRQIRICTDFLNLQYLITPSLDCFDPHVGPNIENRQKESPIFY